MTHILRDIIQRNTINFADTQYTCLEYYTTPLNHPNPYIYALMFCTDTHPTPRFPSFVANVQWYITNNNTTKCIMTPYKFNTNVHKSIISINHIYDPRYMSQCIFIHEDNIPPPTSPANAVEDLIRRSIAYTHLASMHVTLIDDIRHAIYLYLQTTTEDIDQSDAFFWCNHRIFNYAADATFNPDNSIPILRLEIPNLPRIALPHDIITINTIERNMQTCNGTPQDVDILNINMVVPMEKLIIAIPDTYNPHEQHPTQHGYIAAMRRAQNIKNTFIVS